MGLLLFRWVIGFLLCLLGFCFLVDVGASRLLCRGLFGCCLVLLWIDTYCCLLVYVVVCLCCGYLNWWLAWVFRRLVILFVGLWLELSLNFVWRSVWIV